MVAIARALLNEEPAAPRRRADEGARAGARDGRCRSGRSSAPPSWRRSCSSSRTSASSSASRATSSCSTRAASSHTGHADELLADPDACAASAQASTEAGLETFVLLTITGLGLGGDVLPRRLRSVCSSTGLMGVLNFAHGAFITVGAYLAVGGSASRSAGARARGAVSRRGALWHRSGGAPGRRRSSSSR